MRVRLRMMASGWWRSTAISRAASASRRASAGLASSSLTSLVVNGYTKHPAAADALAGYLTVTAADSLYEQTGNIPVKNNVTFANEKLPVVRAQYVEAVEVPKIMQMSSYWLLMESVFSDIWTGADVTERMAEAESSMLTALGQ